MGLFFHDLDSFLTILPSNCMFFPISNDIREDFLHLVLFLHFLVNISQQPFKDVPQRLNSFYGIIREVFI